VAKDNAVAYIMFEGFIDIGGETLKRLFGSVSQNANNQPIYYWFFSSVWSLYQRWNHKKAAIKAGIIIVIDHSVVV